MTDAARELLLYHFCRLQLPAVPLTVSVYQKHMQRTFEVYRAKEPAATRTDYLDSLYAVDWYLCCGCLENQSQAWERLFASRTGRTDCLLLDALRARAIRLYPRDEEKQDSAVSEFWSHLIVSETPGSVPILARYDGQRPLAPWLIRVFQNWHLSQLRSKPDQQTLPDEDIALPLPEQGEDRWHDAFCQAARDWIGDLSEDEALLLGLRLRYRMSQREVAGLFGIHVGNVTRRTDNLRDHFLERIGERLISQGWTGDDLNGFILTEMGALLLDDPRMSADHLATLLAARGKQLPPTNGSEPGERRP
ncbi:MAG: sigma-70 family RNA polymerase sigma factor [Gemmataceae bacterium]